LFLLQENCRRVHGIVFTLIQQKFMDKQNIREQEADANEKPVAEKENSNVKPAAEKQPSPKPAPAEEKGTEETIGVP
jgi:hypothetical protein